jgi:hypothetical protein
MITLLTIYSMFVTPFVMVFPDVYMEKNPDGVYEAVTPR